MARPLTVPDQYKPVAPPGSYSWILGSILLLAEGIMINISSSDVYRSEAPFWIPKWRDPGPDWWWWREISWHLNSGLTSKCQIYGQIIEMFRATLSDCRQLLAALGGANSIDKNWIVATESGVWTHDADLGGLSRTGRKAGRGRLKGVAWLAKTTAPGSLVLSGGHREEWPAIYTPWLPTTWPDFPEAMDHFRWKLLLFGEISFFQQYGPYCQTLNT